MFLLKYLICCVIILFLQNIFNINNNLILFLSHVFILGCCLNGDKNYANKT